MNGYHLNKNPTGASLPGLTLAASRLRQCVHIAEGPEIKHGRARHLSGDTQLLSYLVEVKEIAFEESPSGDL
jgi:hypothetical protein